MQRVWLVGFCLACSEPADLSGPATTDAGSASLGWGEAWDRVLSGFVGGTLSTSPSGPVWIGLDPEGGSSVVPLAAEGEAYVGPTLSAAAPLVSYIGADGPSLVLQASFDGETSSWSLGDDGMVAAPVALPPRWGLVGVVNEEHAFFDNAGMVVALNLSSGDLAPLGLEDDAAPRAMAARYGLVAVQGALLHVIDPTTGDRWTTDEVVGLQLAFLGPRTLMAWDVSRDEERLVLLQLRNDGFTSIVHEEPWPEGVGRALLPSPSGVWAVGLSDRIASNVLATMQSFEVR